MSNAIKIDYENLDDLKIILLDNFKTSNYSNKDDILMQYAFELGYLTTLSYSEKCDLYNKFREIILTQEKIRKDGLSSQNVRFFVYGENEIDIIEVNELDFINADGSIEYERNTIFQNGVNQICLTKNNY